MLATVIISVSTSTAQQCPLGKNLWHTGLLPLGNLCFLMQNALEMVCDSAASTHRIISFFWNAENRRKALNPNPHQPTFPLAQDTSLPGAARRDRGLLEKSSLGLEQKSDLPRVCSLLSQRTDTAPIEALILFLSECISIFFKDTKTEMPNPLNNSYFDSQKQQTLCEQGKRVFSCIGVQEHRVSPFRSFKVHQVEG